MNKETNQQKITRIYNISKVNKSYEEIVEKHRNWLLSDWEFIFEADKIFVNRRRSGFLNLNEWNEHNKVIKEI